MRCHLVTAVINSGDGTKALKKYVATSSDASETKREWQDFYGLKRGQVQSEMVEVPVDKAGLLDFINDLVGAPSE